VGGQTKKKTNQKRHYKNPPSACLSFTLIPIPFVVWPNYRVTDGHDHCYNIRLCRRCHSRIVADGVCMLVAAGSRNSQRARDCEKKSIPAVVSAVSMPETLTIAGLCGLLRALPDLDSLVKAGSEIVPMGVRLCERDGRARQESYRSRPYVEVDKFTPDCINNCLAICLVGYDPAPARALLAALEPCLEKYSDVRVWIRGTRAIAGRPMHVSIPADLHVLEGDPQTTRDLAKAAEALKTATILAESGAMGPEAIATVASIMMPPHWLTTRYYVDSALYVAPQERLPGLGSDDVDRLFVAYGPSAQDSDGKGHGCFIVKAPIPGLTQDMIVKAYGRKIDNGTVADCLVAAAAANVNAATAGASSGTAKPTLA
jgi:hypothetical protein